MSKNIEDISLIINRHDPIRLINEGCPVDEYLPEAQLIYSMWNDTLSFEMFHKNIYKIFEDQFKWILDKPRSQFLPMSREIWSYMKMNELV